MLICSYRKICRTVKEGILCRFYEEGVLTHEVGRQVGENGTGLSKDLLNHS